MASNENSKMFGKLLRWESEESHAFGEKSMRDGDGKCMHALTSGMQFQWKVYRIAHPRDRVDLLKSIFERRKTSHIMHRVMIWVGFRMCVANNNFISVVNASLNSLAEVIDRSNRLFDSQHRLPENPLPATIAPCNHFGFAFSLSFQPPLFPCVLWTLANRRVYMCHVAMESGIYAINLAIMTSEDQ